VPALLQLLTPLSYLRIKHPLKQRFDVAIPASIASLITAILIFLPIEVKLFGNSGLIDIITGLIQILTGFFIASLAAVATFQRSTMDEPLAGNQATLATKIKGVSKNISLTRRRFLSFLFGYLAFSGICLYFLGSSANLLLENARMLIPAQAHSFVKWMFIYLYLFGTSNLLVTTFLGLHYMTDRIHR